MGRDRDNSLFIYRGTRTREDYTTVSAGNRLSTEVWARHPKKLDSCDFFGTGNDLLVTTDWSYVHVSKTDLLARSWLALVVEVPRFCS